MLYDAIRKVITLVAALCIMLDLSDWRQSKHNLKTIKRLFRKAQQLKRSTSKKTEKTELREVQIIEAHQEYIDKVQEFLARARTTIEKIDMNSLPLDIKLLQISVKIMEIQSYMQHAERQIDQTGRRVVKGEKIPHAEKVFSIFQDHTEWISKGKAGVPVELGLKVCVLEDQHGFILQHMVMKKQTDDQVAVSMVEQTLEIFP
ncbi:ISNCY family transposase, partial [bacterium]|nr:ISNCY family transposase [bacterium]